MKLPADFIGGLLWRMLPHRFRVVLSSYIRSAQERSLTLVPVSKVEVYGQSDKICGQFAKFPINKPGECVGSGGRPEFSLLITCYNEENSIQRLLDSVLKQSVLPQELIIVDGGSTDRTLQRITEWENKSREQLGIPVQFELRVINPKRRLNISQGRNIAVQAAQNELIAFTDAGCELDRFWLERLLYPFLTENKIDVSMGWYHPVTRTAFAEAVAHFLVPTLSSIDPRVFLPSARSLALKKSVFLSAGSFPEFLTRAGEDSLFDYYLKFTGARFAFVPEALVFWRFPQEIKAMFKTAYSYALGDAEGGKLFWAYYLKLIDFAWKVFVEVVLLVLVFNLNFLPTKFAFALKLLLICSIFTHYFVFIRSYRPFAGIEVSSKKMKLFNYGRRFLALHLVVVAQLAGFIRGLSFRPKVESARVLSATAGHIVILDQFPPICNESGIKLNEVIRRYLDSGWFITLIYAFYPEKAASTADVFLFEHPRLDTYLRSAFDLEQWGKKYKPLVLQEEREFSVRDLCNDSFSRPLVEGFKTLGARNTG